ncbi:MAG: CBS domain-containing protein, partial [Hominimerdicola sp.]
CIDYIEDDFTVRQAIEKMRHHGFTALPVINEKGEYVKTLAEGDLLWFMIDNDVSDMKELEHFSVNQIARRIENKPVYVYSTIEDLILQSINQNFVPVIDDRDVFIGIVTRSDILKYCYSTLQELNEKYNLSENSDEFADSEIVLQSEKF